VAGLDSAHTDVARWYRESETPSLRAANVSGLQVGFHSWMQEMFPEGAARCIPRFFCMESENSLLLEIMNMGDDEG
jgi:hypothetical protein